MGTKQRMFLSLILLTITGAALLLAQGDRGQITGTVTDATGAVTPGSTITAIQTSTNVSYKTTSNTAGDFTIPSLPVGTYLVRVEKEGFKRHTTNNVVITP